MSDAAGFGTFGRFVETPVHAMESDMKASYDVTPATSSPRVTRPLACTWTEPALGPTDGIGWLGGRGG